MAELTQLDRDYSLAQDLLNGARGVDKNGVQRRVFLSGKEEEAGRKALRRVLEYFAKTTGANILEDIANLFDPIKQGERKVVFKRLNQGHTDPVRDEDISNLVFLSCTITTPTKTRETRLSVIKQKSGRPMRLLPRKRA